jgi:hypothetical protein
VIKPSPRIPLAAMLLHADVIAIIPGSAGRCGEELRIQGKDR